MLREVCVIGGHLLNLVIIVIMKSIRTTSAGFFPSLIFSSHSTAAAVFEKVRDRATDSKFSDVIDVLEEGL